MIHVVLFQPEIPQNTGNIMRTCSATGATLHIIGPLKFSLTDDNLKRAGMDYITTLDYHYYDSYEDFQTKNAYPEIYCVTRYAKVAPSSFELNDKYEDYYFMFGRESTGIPMDILKENKERCMRLPMKPHARSLNLSNCVAVIIYEALRQLDYDGLATEDFIKEEDYL
jgi:tRNA (cytidine/uridine-2'-O-)-methyltransferase